MEGNSERGLRLLKHRGQETLKGRATLSMTSRKRRKLILDLRSNITEPYSLSRGQNKTIVYLFFITV